MTTPIKRNRLPPRGLSRLFFRLPIWLYRWRLGWLLGQRFLLLHHVGRKSGLPRQAVIEVAGYDAGTDAYTVAAGYGPQSDWYRNLQQTPAAAIQVGRRSLSVTAVLLSPTESGEAMVRYARQHPQAARALARVLGFTLTGTEDEYRQIGQQYIPFVTFHPRTP